MGEAYWEWRDQELAHPDGRARGGEPCVVCGGPVPPNAHWKQRDRHVCSSPCNHKLSRRFNRRRDRGDVVPPPPVLDPYSDREPLHFYTDLTLPFPYGFLGLSPRDGDFVERHGSVVYYQRVRLTDDELAGVREQLGTLDEMNADLRWTMATRSMLVHHLQSGSQFHAIVEDGSETLAKLAIGSTLPDRTRGHLGQPFEHGGRRWAWEQEIIRHVEPDDSEHSWRAYVCLPYPRPELWQSTMWTPEYHDRSQRLRRISSHTARHARRVRMVGPDGKVQRIDPLGIFERDGWVCQLCGDPIDPDRQAPDLMSASLDHVVPLAARGEHTYENVQAAHLLCNIQKGART